MQNITNRILEKLQEVEASYGVKVLLAVESGSRAWGFDSPDSDYDVRFVYIHPMEWYLSLRKDRDVIEYMSEDHVFDLAGWDIRKALGLLAGSNASFMEWLNSPIVYMADQSFLSGIRTLAEKSFDVRDCVNHYYHISVNHNKRYLVKDGYTLKRFQYYFRGLLACKWIIERKSIPPVLFEDLVNQLVDDNVILSQVQEMLVLKRESKEHYGSEVPTELVRFAESIASNVEAVMPSLPSSDYDVIPEMDTFFIKELKRNFE